MKESKQTNKQTRKEKREHKTSTLNSKIKKTWTLGEEVLAFESQSYVHS